MQRVIGWLGYELWKCFRGLEEKSDFLCKSELSSDGCLVLVVCYESFNAAGRRHCDLDPLSTKLGGTQNPQPFHAAREIFKLMSVHLAPIPLVLCYCLVFNNNGVAFKSLRLTALSDNHKRICVRLKTSLSAKLLIAPGRWSYYD